MEPEPRPLDELDSVLGADSVAAAAHVLGHFEPYLPTDAAEAAFDALVARYRLRWNEYWGPVGERIRMLEADGLIRVDRARGVIVDAASDQPLQVLPSSSRRDVRGVRPADGVT